MNSIKLNLVILLASFSMSLFSATYSISSISLGYGKLDVSAGSGNMLVNTESNGKLQSVSIDVNAGFFGIKHRIQYTESVSNLSSGKAINFYMEGGSVPVLKLKSSGRFDPAYGGKLSFSVLKSEGYETTTIAIKRDAISKRYYLWDTSDRIIADIGLNMRGYSLASMYVGWYELNLK